MKKYFFECNDCGKQITSDDLIYLCPDCEKQNDAKRPPKGVLKTLYVYDEIKKKYPKDLFFNLQQNRFLDLLPLISNESRPFLDIGNTPLYEIKQKEKSFHLFLKDDSQNPTFSFKDRASEIVSAFARESKINTIVAASTGNAGSSIAGICASQRQKAIVFVPASAPKAKLTQILMYGAQIVPVDGNYDSAFDLSIAATKKYGWYNRNTAYNPFTIEGKKTVSFELYAQLNQTVPDKVFVPVGDGVIISGVYKGFEDLLKLNIIDKMPVIIAVQAEGSNNIISNLNNKSFISIPSKTIADSISVDIPRNFYMAKKYLVENNGEWITVSDDEILNASLLLSKESGIFSEPAAVAAYAGMLKYNKEKKIAEGEKVVVLLTGSGLKDLNSVQPKIEIPASVKPDITSVEKFLNQQ